MRESGPALISEDGNGKPNKSQKKVAEKGKSRAVW
jgi:hypothetical protein